MSSINFLSSALLFVIIFKEVFVPNPNQKSRMAAIKIKDGKVMPIDKTIVVKIKIKVLYKFFKFWICIHMANVLCEMKLFQKISKKELVKKNEQFSKYKVRLRKIRALIKGTSFESKIQICKITICNPTQVCKVFNMFCSLL